MKADAYNKYIGQILDRKYKIVKTIGIGGMAVVFEAYDIETGKRVAIKMLKDTIENDTQAIRRFINESRAISMMDSDNIVKISYVSVSGPHKFIAMEYIDGITLREYMNHKGIVSWSETVEFSIQILTALSHAHSKGIIHRDIKPQNIMLTEGGYVKVTDFGIAKIPKAETLTMIDKAIGTVYYISPEQARGLKIDARSDLYSLGIMMYEMVTGRLPFVAETAISVLVSHMNEKPKPPTMYNPNIPKGLEQIILCMLEKDPENRYQSASQAIRQLNQLKKNPTIIFPQRRPIMKTPTAEHVIGETQRRENALYGREATGEIRKTTSDDIRIGNIPKPRPSVSTQDATAPNIPFAGARPRTRKSSSFALVIVVLVIFVAAALVGLGMVFGMLISGRESVAGMTATFSSREGASALLAMIRAAANAAGIL